MANNYSQGTTTPDLVVTDEQALLLHAASFNTEPGAAGKVYIYCEESWTEDTDWWLENLEDALCDEAPEGEDVDEWVQKKLAEWKERIDGWGLEDIFRWILQNPENADEDHVFFEAAHTCSKMRPGEFGGVGLTVTRTQYCWVNSSAVKVVHGVIQPVTIMPIDF